MQAALTSPGKADIMSTSLKWWNGRHRGLKIPCLRAYGFESRLQHQLLSQAIRKGGRAPLRAATEKMRQVLTHGKAWDEEGPLPLAVSLRPGTVSLPWICHLCESSPPGMPG